MKYKVGDKVKIKKNLIVDGSYGSETYVEDMEEIAKDYDYILTVSKVFDCYGDNIEYVMAEGDGWYWTNKMIEGLAEPTDREKFEGWMRKLSSLDCDDVVWNAFNYIVTSEPDDRGYDDKLKIVSDFLFTKKKMTKTEIEAELGYKIEIVEE